MPPANRVRLWLYKLMYNERTNSILMFTILANMVIMFCVSAVWWRGGGKGGACCLLAWQDEVLGGGGAAAGGGGARKVAITVMGDEQHGVTGVCVWERSRVTQSESSGREDCTCRSAAAALLHRM